MPVTLPPGASHPSPGSRSQPPQNAEREPDAISTVDDDRALFDERPADSIEPPSLLDRVIAKLSEAFQATARLVRDALGLSKLPSIHENSKVSISAPRNRRNREASLPPELAAANKEAAELARTRQQARQAQADFVDSRDNPLAPQPMFADADANDFSSYLKLCELNGGKPGEMVCPQNFLPGVQRHAKAFLDLIRQRQQAALASGKEYTLSTTDQQKRDALARLLAQSHDRQQAELGRQALASGPVASVTSTQLTSFMSWREWRNHGEENGQPAHAIDFDAAQAYAKELLDKYKDSNRAIGELKEMLLDAESLLEHAELHRILIDSASRAIPANTAQGAPQVPVPKQEALPADEASERVAAPPPPPPAPRARAAGIAKSRSISDDLGLPPVNSLTAEDVHHAIELFDRFVQEYSRSPQGVRLEPTSPFLYPECVAVANDFAEMVAGARDLALGPDQLTKLQAALKLRELYSQYRQAAPKA